MGAEYYSNIKNKLNEIKHLGEREILSNVVAAKVTPESEYLSFIDKRDAVGFTIKEKYKNEFYFSSASEESLKELLSGVEKDTFCSFFYRDTNDYYDEILQKNGWNLYAIYYRITVVYDANTYEAPVKGRRVILQEMYDPDDGEVPTFEDIPELIEILKEQFDPIADDFYDEDEWKEIINRRECLVCKEEGKIITLYVWHIEKNTLYSSMIINYGAANHSYNLERRVFEQAFKDGIRKHYWWLKATNKKAVDRHGIVSTGSGIKSCGVLNNAIYIKL